MQKAILLLVLLLAFYAGQSQTQNSLDSLARAIPSMANDTGKVKALLALGQMYLGIAPREAVQYGEQALALAEKLGWKKGIASSNGAMGVIYNNLSDFHKALEYLQKSLQMNRALNDLSGMARSYSAIGNAYYFQSDYPQALDYYLESVKLCEKTGDRYAAAPLSNIGAIYMDLEKYPEALEYFEKAKKLNEESGNKTFLAVNFSNIGIVYSKLGNEAKALEYYFKAVAIDEKTGNMAALSFLYPNIGTSYLNKGDLDNALNYAQKTMRISRELDDKGNLAFSYGLTGKIYLTILQTHDQKALNRYFSGDANRCLQTAKTYADSSIALNRETGLIDQLKNGYELLSTLQMLQGDHKSALENYQQYTALKDSIFNMEEDRKITQTAMQYEFDKKEAVAQAEQEKKDIRQRNVRNSIAAGLLGALLFLIVVYRQRNRIAREKKRAEELLLNILPEEVARELQEKGSADAKMIDEVTVLFSDFKGFTQASEKVSPRELVAEINECFSAFDQIMTKYGVEKIKTIGDAYMAAGGLPTPNLTHALDVVHAALEMQQFMLDRKKSRDLSDKLNFEIRIGVHTGPVVAGIVGLKKFAYDIWGDTVNTASRMESSSESGKINISGTTYEKVKGHFVCIHRGKIQAKGKGEINMYFVESEEKYY